jgi:septal ring factor EnvC (AmiA/AmiB activator)
LNAAAPKSNSYDWSKWIPIFITILTLTVGTVAWAVNSSADAKYAIEQARSVKTELEVRMEKIYVQKSEFSRVEQSLKDQKEDMTEVKSKLDRLLEVMSRPNRPTNAR